MENLTRNEAIQLAVIVLMASTASVVYIYTWEYSLMSVSIYLLTSIIYGIMISTVGIKSEKAYALISISSIVVYGVLAYIYASPLALLLYTITVVIGMFLPAVVKIVRGGC